MLPKVSLVMPCYNKEKYIDAMLESVLAQKWNNIELILVNDGSTDNTRKIITEYVPKFISKGIEVIIIDQENQGVAAAVCNGLRKISGDFVCQIDADDELDSEYVSLMADCLDKDSNIDWVVCDSWLIKSKYSVNYRNTFTFGKKDTRYLIEQWLLMKMHTPIWLYMVRVKYLVKCNVINLYYTGREGNQEPQYILPLALGGGTLFYLRKPLYRHNQMEPKTNNRSFFFDAESAKKRINGLIAQCNKVIHLMPISECKKVKLCAISELSYGLSLVHSLLEYNNSNDIAEAMDNLLKKVYLYFTPASCISNKDIYSFLRPFGSALANNIMGIRIEPVDFSKGRVIAWGVLGKNSRILLPFLIGTPLEPTDLWDISQNNLLTKQPDVSSVTKNDTVLIFPSQPKGDIYNQLEDSGCRRMLYEDICSYISYLKFPKFYDGKVKFAPTNSFYD